MKRALSLLGFSLFLSLLGYSQSTPVRGIAEKELSIHAFTNATIHVSSEKVLENATLIVKNGRITAVGTQVSVPVNAVVQNMEGKHLYPSFVELNSDLWVKQLKNEKGESPVYEKTNKGAYYWNDAIRPQVAAKDLLQVEDKAAEEMRKAGFGAVLAHNQDGIARGTSVALTLGSKSANEVLINSPEKPFFSFKKGSSYMSYPSSLMGSIALLRQSFYDAKNYNSNNGIEENLGLAKLKEQMKSPGFFEVQEKWDLYRADKIAKEFGINWIYIGGNDIYENPDAFRNMNLNLVVPINHPKAYDASDPLAMSMLGMEDLKAYDWAPNNLKTLEQIGATYSLSASGVEKPHLIFQEIKLAIEAGANPKRVMDALTINPARFAGIDKELGSLEKGKLANFLVCSKELFDKENKILSNVVRGEAFEINAEPNVDFSGKYKLALDGITYELTLKQGDKGLSGSLLQASDSSKSKIQISTQGYGISMAFKLSEEENAYYRLHGRKTAKGIAGSGKAPNGFDLNFSAEKLQQTEKDEKSKDEAEEFTTVSNFSYPLKAFGYSSIPAKQSMLIKNATVWTNEKDGVLQNTDVLVVNGYITQIAKNIPVANWTVIDGTGKHLTAGIVDEHSHIAIARGVNEGGQAVSAEVSISDVVNPEDINIYRQLSGGVTTAQLLHGSANPIGGQSALIKLKYGTSPEEMKIDNAPGFIKFALGENVKQANWGDDYNKRYPQTRMGVEQVYYDAFHRALEYEKAKTSKTPPAYNLEYETLLEILKGKRFISCHSYIQSEINMLMHVADSMGFTVNTFTHILEGYKVADKMAAHGASGSTFSDW